MKLPCAVTRDLLPLYAEKMVEPETGELIDQHLKDCPACREKLSELNTDTGAPVETAQPLQSLKKQIRKRRRYAAAIAALCVFVAVFTCFYHGNKMRLVPWEEGLIEVKGIEARPWQEVYGEDAVPAESNGDTVNVLVLRADSRINGTRESLFRDEDGKSTLILQGWTSQSGSTAREYHEMVFSPVPDRLIYEDGNEQRLLWGEPLNGGMETLPRLALGFYVILAAGLALVSGIAWFFLRGNKKSRIVRQVFFAPLSYLAAHLLIKGFRTESFFMERDFIAILLLTAALYALLSLAWQALLQRKRG
ncbi:MAG: zf-HC2 domain-containing protein [Clostridia bacterium]|nr:zf-HC2 domain-containing protein [Clostridia bacterium]